MVAARAAAEDVTASQPDDHVLVLAAENKVAAVAANDNVRPRSSEDYVLAQVRVDVVAAATAADGVIARFASDAVVTSEHIGLEDIALRLERIEQKLEELAARADT